jgi:hypothetical protein
VSLFRKRAAPGSEEAAGQANIRWEPTAGASRQSFIVPSWLRQFGLANRLIAGITGLLGADAIFTARSLVYRSTGDAFEAGRRRLRSDPPSRPAGGSVA